MRKPQGGGLKNGRVLDEGCAETVGRTLTAGKGSEAETPARNAFGDKEGHEKATLIQNFLQTWLPQLSTHWHVPIEQLLEVS